MSDTTDLTIERFRKEAPLLEAVCRQIARHVDADEVDLVVRFAEIFFSKAPPGFLQERSVDALARMAIGAFRFLETSRPERVDVQVFNPDVDNEGWFAPVTVIRTNISERPFVVDSIREFLTSQDLGIEQYIYPVLQVDRGDDGSVRSLGPSRDGERPESMVHCEVARVADEDHQRFLLEEVTRRLRDVVRATDDFPHMLAALDETVRELESRREELEDLADEIGEVQSFLQWLRDGGFVFLGYRGYDIVDMAEDPGAKAIVVEPGSGLGILRNEAESTFAEPVAVDELPESTQRLVMGGPVVIISKTNATATVHRRARMDYIGVKKLAPDGTVVGERRFIGLFTSQAYSEKADNIPILRQKLQRILDEAGVQEGSHDFKEIHTIFNSMPKEELFLTSAEEIGADVRTVLTTHDSEDVRVTLRRDPLNRGVSIMVIMAKERFSGEVRKRIESAFVEELEGEVLNYHLHLALGEGDQARLHFYLGAPEERLEQVDPRRLEELVRSLIRSWTDRVREGLERIRPPDEARRLARVYGQAFSPEYQAATEPEVAVRDILELEAMVAQGRSIAIAFSNPPSGVPVAGGDRVTELKVYLRHERLVLSDFMPILENAGLRVIAVNPYEIRDRGSPRAILYTFVVQDAGGEPLEIEVKGTLLAETILAVQRKEASNDPLNALVISAGLAWREVEVLRAYASYGFQIGAVPSRLSLPSALRKYPEIARVLFRLFEVRFDPEGPGNVDDRREALDRIRREFHSALSEVTVLGDDRALRRLAVLILGTVRTNYYRYGGSVPTRRSGGVPYISLKFDCRELQSITRNRLLYEVWVRSARMEGVHMRGARVARGGIRHSDRPDDFRTEVLGLVRTQMVKNAVIVPAGSKGGFVTLRTPQDREARQEEAREQYSTLIRGLLDITDNLREGEVVHPQDVFAWDDFDPYLVVAADKGTATFSDVANEVAAEYAFWLGDAFASGGSHGYDHKELGITARGAWECVKRHFMEKGKDIQSEPFTVVGIGDMSGDVFGNGMLLSRAIRLVAAFDHRDIFIDPDPDPETSYEERIRLFEMGRSSWQDYDRSVLSAGGMIIPRGAKEVKLTPQARRVLGVPDDDQEMDGESLIRAILGAPVELLWNGGIGTYVKADHETHADVGDPSNDAVRIDASDLRAEVVGEGGNLGLTQPARIRYALAGGRLNTDAIDNSGGVDLSDREVNLKILLSPVVAAGEMTIKRRNELLDELKGPISDLVLADNRAQSLAVSLDEIRTREAVDDLRDLMSELERAGILDRADEHLPSWEVLLERVDRGQAFTRPELSVLLAYAKLHLAARLMQSGIPDESAVESYLLDYFPLLAREVSGEERLREHRLRREIITSQLTNDLVDLMGTGFIHRVCRDTGRTPAEVARAWLIASRLADHHALLRNLKVGEARGGMSFRSVYRWLLGLGRVLDRTTRWVLANVDADADAAQVIEKNVPGLARLRAVFGEIVSGDDRKIFDDLVREIRQSGAEDEFARHLITLRFLDQLLEILRVSRRTGADPLDVARAFYRVSELFRVPWLRRKIQQAARDNRWDQRAAQGLNEDLTDAHQRIAAVVMRSERTLGGVGAALDDVVGGDGNAVQRFRGLLQEIQDDEPVSLAAVSVAVRELVGLASQFENGRQRS